MEISGDSFLNKNWIITEWAPNPKEGVLPDGLVKKETQLKITADGEGFHVQWLDQDNIECTIAPPLTLRGESLETPPKASVEIEAGLERIAVASAFVKLQVVVSFADIGDGNLGTFTAEARPVGDPGNDAG